MRGTRREGWSWQARGKGEGQAVVGSRVRACRGSTPADVLSLCLTSLLHPPVGCPVRNWVPDVWPFPFPLKAGLLVAGSRPLHAVRVHGAHSCKRQPWVLCLSEESKLQRLRFWLGRRSRNDVVGVHRLL